MCVSVCVTKRPQRVTLNWAYTQSDHWSMSPSPPKDRREKELRRQRGRERTRELGGVGGTGTGDAWVSKYWRSTSSEKGFVCRGCFILCGCVCVCVCVWLFTSACHPAFSSYRTGGDREEAESSHPRTSLLSGLLLLSSGEDKTQSIVVNLLTQHPTKVCSIYVIIKLQ